jgi:predicted helicase
MVDGAHFGERKHWLQDDYVKFIRFAQSKMEIVDQGAMAVITNHSWIYNPTFRGMRQSLMNSSKFTSWICMEAQNQKSGFRTAQSMRTC